MIFALINMIVLKIFIISYVYQSNYIFTCGSYITMRVGKGSKELFIISDLDFNSMLQPMVFGKASSLYQTGSVQAMDEPIHF